MRKLLYINASNVRVCIELHYVKKILQMVYLEPVPGSVASFVGLMNYAGSSIPVFDLALSLGVHREKMYTLETPIIILSDENKEIGIIVDEIYELVELEEGLKKSTDMIEEETSLFSEIINVHSNMALLLNVKRLATMNIMKNKESSFIKAELLQKVTGHHG